MNLEKATEILKEIKFFYKMSNEISPMKNEGGSFEKLQALDYFISLAEKVEKAIEILGRPVMTYAPESMVEEYDEKIIQAVNYLTGKDKI